MRSSKDFIIRLPKRVIQVVEGAQTPAGVRANECPNYAWIRIRKEIVSRFIRNLNIIHMRVSTHSIQTTKEKLMTNKIKQ